MARRKKHKPKADPLKRERRQKYDARIETGRTSYTDTLLSNPPRADVPLVVMRKPGLM